MHEDKNQDQAVERLRAFVRHEGNRAMSRRQFLRFGLSLGLSLPTVSGVLGACAAPPAAQVAAPSPAPPTPLLTPTPESPLASPTPPPTPAPSPLPSPTPVPAIRFAVIGDFGLAGEPAQAVADLVHSWNVQFIVTTGDNNYPDGAADTIDANVGQYYHDFIAPYKGTYGQGADVNRFFPVLGNHDWVVGYPEPYLSYFTLPEPQRYYRFDWGPARFCMLDSMPDEPDGVRSDSIQGQWLQAELAASLAAWNVVVLHHPPFSSGHHGSNAWMQWPFAEWGADLVLGGHDHNYERIVVDGLTYIVNGLGGGARYAPGTETVAGSQIFFNADHGAMLVDLDAQKGEVQFITRQGKVIDSFRLE